MHGSDLRDIPNLDLGWGGFLLALMRDSMPDNEPRKNCYIDEMFELEMRIFWPDTDAGGDFEIDGTP